MTALRTLLAGIVDYAGLFPPAGLDMTAAVRNYAAYQRDDHAWMLGRFVVPIARLDEFERAHGALDVATDTAWRLSALLGADVESDVARARAFNLTHAGRAAIDSLEGALGDESAIARAVSSGLLDDFTLFAELPSMPDPAPLLAAIKRAGINAKLRTGGLTADTIPLASAIVRYLRRCIEYGMRFKATAGLHHPVSAEHPLTYEADAPRGVMFGYLNVFLAAGLMMEGMTDADAVRVLDERRTDGFRIASSAIEWETFRLTTAQLRQTRDRLAVSFGSCSFREPVDELQLLLPR
jgi:hypothetical protein